MTLICDVGDVGASNAARRLLPKGDEGAGEEEAVRENSAA